MNTPDPATAFRNAIEAAGIPPPPFIQADGKLHRFPTNEKPGDDAGWFVYYPDHPPAGAFGCWRSGLKGTWCAYGEDELSQVDLSELRRKMEAAQEARQAEEEERQDEAQSRAADIWEHARPGDPEHAYLQRKQVQPHGIKQDGDQLVIPVWDVEGTLFGLQFIGPEGSKNFLRGTAKAGHFFWIGATPSDTLAIAEGFATAASVHEATGLPVAVAFDAGNLEPVSKTLRGKFPAARIFIFGDNDENGVGQEKANSAAAAIGGQVVIPPNGGDWNDVYVAEGLEAVRAAFARADHADPGGDADEPLPLFPPLPPAERFPIEALGTVLSPAAAAIARKVQVPEAIAAQSVLAVAALAAQAHADVLLPYGQTRPLSLFLITVAASGDRKSSADNEALWPIRKRERALQEEYERQHQQWSITHAAWAAEKRKIEANKEFNFDRRKTELAALGAEPVQPLYPFLTAPEPTVEGLVKAWVHAPASLGIFSAEGGQFIGGHGMSQDHRLKTASTCSNIWDGEPFKRIRAADGVTILYGRRLSVHLMVQVEVASQFLAEPVLRDQGLLWRFLAAAPASIAGTRFYREPLPEDNQAIAAYGARILALLEAPWPMAEGKANELQLPALSFSAEAEAEWKRFYDYVEGQCRPNSDLFSLRGFAAKAAEQAARIAGVLTIVQDPRATEIGMVALKNALWIAHWYVTETMRLQKAARTDPRLVRAKALLDWLHQQGEEIAFRDVLRLGPNQLRQKATAEDALSILAAHGWVSEICKRPRRYRINREG